MANRLFTEDELRMIARGRTAAMAGDLRAITQTEAMVVPRCLLLCDYCDTLATFCPSSAHVYRGRDYGPIWHCAPCDAWVGCHKGNDGTRPLGRLANKALRQAKQATHAAFDPIWQRRMEADGISKAKARGRAYAWLAVEMGIDPLLCHIGMFDEAMCQRAIDICCPVAVS